MVWYNNDNNKYVFNTWNNHGVIEYDKDIVEKRHQEQYSLALALFRITKYIEWINNKIKNKNYYYWTTNTNFNQ